MNKGRVIVNITKNMFGPAVNSKWSVFIDGRFVGNADFKNNFNAAIENGEHNIQLKVGLQSTAILSFVVNDDDVVVECAYDGTVSKFYVVSEQGSLPQSSTTVENPISSPHPMLVNPQTRNSASKRIKLRIILIGILVVFGFFGILGSLEESGGYTINSEVLEAAEKEAKSRVSYDCAEVPEVSSECIYKGSEFAIVKVSYKTKTEYCSGTYFFKVSIDYAMVYPEAKHCSEYDYEMSDEDLEVIKAQWVID